MSSQRVVTFELSARQRAQLHATIDRRRRVRAATATRVQERTLARLASLREELKRADVENDGLPAESDVVAVFADVDAAPSEVAAAIDERLELLATAARSVRVAPLAADLGDATVQASITRLLAAVPDEEIPAGVSSVVERIRLQPAERRRLLHELSLEVAAVRKRSLDRAYERIELDEVAAIAAILDQEDLAGRLEVAEALWEEGVASGAGRLLELARLRREQAEARDALEHAAVVLQALWLDLGYSIYQVGGPTEFLAVPASGGVGVDVRVDEGATVMQQVGIEGRAITEDEAHAVCEDAAEVEAQAAAGGLPGTVQSIAPATARPARTVAVDIQPSVAPAASANTRDGRRHKTRTSGG